MNIYIRLLTITLSLICVTQIIHAQDGEVTQITSQKKALGLELGARLPELVVTDQLGKEVPLAAAKGDRWVYVFFYPMALTSGWTKQACSVQDALENLTAKKVSIFGVSTDTVETQMTFAKKEALQYSLISDIDKKVTKAFKVPLLMNKLAKRQAYLFKDGILVWRDTSASTKNQGDKVLDAIKENS